MNDTLALHGERADINARVLLGLMLLAAACLFADALVGMRGLDVGTDTRVYADVFMAMRHGLVTSRFEPGFYYLTALLAASGISVAGYQAALFLVLLGTVVIATRRYHEYLGSTATYMTFLAAALLWLFVSPVLTQASINAVRQGLASLLVFTALLAFQQRQWRSFFLYGVLATCFHYSSVMYLLFAPTLLFSTRLLRVVAVLAFLAYCSGLTMIVVRAVLPSLYNFVMTYDATAEYKSGVRIDFAVFSIFWYALPYLLSGLVRQPVRERLIRSTAIYLVLMLPFFAVGWGSYSNRYLLPAWLSASLMVAAIFSDNRLPPLRNPLLLRMGLLASCGLFYYYVTHGVVL